MKNGFAKVYFIGLHFLVLILIAAIVFAISLIRADRRMPGSQLAATYSSGDGQWGHYIKHDGRDIVVGVTEKSFGVETILVSPPDSTLLWEFSRTADKDWQVFVTEYASNKEAERHFDHPVGKRVLIDGPPYGELDGYPDREVILHEDKSDRFQLARPVKNPVLDKVSP